MISFESTVGQVFARLRMRTYQWRGYEITKTPFEDDAMPGWPNAAGHTVRRNKGFSWTAYKGDHGMEFGKVVTGVTARRTLKEIVGNDFLESRS